MCGRGHAWWGHGGHTCQGEGSVHGRRDGLLECILFMNMPLHRNKKLVLAIANVCTAKCQKSQLIFA